MSPMFKALAVALFFFQIPVNAADKWPQIENYKEKFKLSDNLPSVIDYVFSKSGESIYKINCHPQDFIDEEGFDYRGLIQCRLSVVDSIQPNSDILISESDWNPNAPRSSFMIDLSGRCSKHRYYGSVRHFFARGLKITFKIKNVRISNRDILEALRNGQNLKKYRFNFEIAIENSPHHISERAEGFSSYCYASYKITPRNNIIEILDTGRTSEMTRVRRSE